MAYTLRNLRRIKRRSNKLRVIKGQGFLDLIRKKLSQGKEWVKKKIPKIVEGVKEVGTKHWNEIKEGGIPLSKDAFIKRGKSLAADALSATRKEITGSGRRRVRKINVFPQPNPKRLRYTRK